MSPNIRKHKMQHKACGGIFFELDGYELDKCPHCQKDLAEENSVSLESEEVEIKISHLTGEIVLSSNK